MRVAIAQTDCRLGLVEDNLDRARSHVEEAHARGADLVVLPELALHGYALGKLDHDTALEAHDRALLSLGEVGPDVLVGPLDNSTYWRDLVHQLARMQQCYVVMVNRVGSENGVSFWGGSRIVDPFGQVVAEAPLDEGALVTGDLDLGEVRRLRHRLPLLQDPRFGLLSRELQRLTAEL